MDKEKYLTNRKTLSVLKLIKISFIAFTSIFLILNFVPFYQGVDSYLYGVESVRIANGSFEYTNELLAKTGNELFLPGGWTQTINENAIPKSSIGIFGFSTLSYLLAGYFGLFYLSPIFTILLLITSERVATKLFGEFAGFITLIIVGTDSILLLVGLNLLTDNIFSLFFILGTFFLIKFFQTKKQSSIFLCSIFFVIATFVRINGIVAFPIEMVLLGFFALQTIRIQNKNSKFLSKDTPKQILFKIKSYKFLRNSSLIFLPWLVFFIFWFGFNEYYFGDPAANYREPMKSEITSGYVTTLVSLEENRFEWVKFFSVGLLPDFFQSNLFEFTDSDVHSSFYRNLSFMIASCILIFALVVSIFERKNRTKVFLMIFLAISFLIFYSARVDDPSQSVYATEGIQTRFMLPSFVLFTMILGYLTDRMLKKLPEKISKNNSLKFSTAIRGGVLVTVMLFMFFSFYDDSFQARAILYSEYKINNPVEFASKYPLNSEGLSPDNVIFWGSNRSIEYDVIPLSPDISRELHTMWDPNLISQEPIELIKKLDEDGYKIYTFKDIITDIQKKYYVYLQEEHGIILKTYSKTFCQMKIIGTENIGRTSDAISDGSCILFSKRAKVLYSLDELP